MGVLLAEEQLAGRLRLSLRTLSTSSELRTPEAAARIEEAFGLRPFDLYATTEGLWGGECERRAGPHLFEDDVIVENVADDGRAVPDGTPGARLLVTNLVNRVQPLIRLEVSDAVTLSATTCGCGRTLRRLERVEGRAEDVIWLAGADGRPVAVVPMQFSVVARDRDVVEFQVAQQGARLVILVVGRGAAPGSRSACAPAWPSGCARWAWRRSRSTCAAAMPSSARPVASWRWSSPIVGR